MKYDDTAKALNARFNKLNHNQQAYAQLASLVAMRMDLHPDDMITAYAKLQEAFNGDGKPDLSGLDNLTRPVANFLFGITSIAPKMLTVEEFKATIDLLLDTAKAAYEAAKADVAAENQEEALAE